jgi:coenzyme F420-dependent glucose-6-phosphate dehydrogenase
VQPKRTSVEDPLQVEEMAAADVNRTCSLAIDHVSDLHEHAEHSGTYLATGPHIRFFHASGYEQQRFVRMYASQVQLLLRKAFA